MKVAELREKLAKLKKEEVIKIAVECYKLVPKAKKEDYKLDKLIENPSQPKATKEKVSESLDVIERDVKDFMENAKEQNYLYPNQIISKKERPKWRFKVKNWHKELTKRNRPDKNLGRQARILSDLYGLISDAERFSYFSTDEPFRSIGIAKADFFQSILILMDEHEGKVNVVNTGLGLMVKHNFGSDYIVSELTAAFIEQLTVPDLKYQAIEKTTKHLKALAFAPPKTDKRGFSFLSTDEFRKQSKNNSLTELVFRLHASLYEYDEAITFFEQHYYDKTPEVKLYILIDLLFDEQQAALIQQQIEKAIKAGIKPRVGLNKLLEIIKNGEDLPRYIPSNW